MSFGGGGERYIYPCLYMFCDRYLKQSFAQGLALQLTDTICIYYVYKKSE